MEQVFGSILAGGSGVRLWPLSRKAQPKHLIPFHHQKTLLELTYQRLTQIISPDNCALVTTVEQQQAIKKLLPQLQLIIEPCARNTAAALLLAVLEIAEKHPHATLLFVPADHYIKDYEAFNKAIEQALLHAQKNKHIVLLGLPPSFPSTEFGYIEPGKAIEDATSFVTAFHEKPSLEKAQHYIQQGFLWNCGIFCAQAAVFVREYEKHALEMLQTVKRFRESHETRLYETLPALSFDQAVLEKSDRCCVLTANFGWSDVGTLEAFITARKENDTEIIAHNAHNNLVCTTKKTVLMDVENLCVIETDDLLFVSTRENLSRMKSVVAQLEQSHNELL